MDKNKWNIIDKIIAKFRYIEVDKYVIRNSVIMDIGCGQEGKFLLRHKDEISHGYGLDYKIESHEEGNLTFINNKNVVNVLNNNTVDTVFMNAVLEHLPNPKEVLKEAIDKLKVGGKLVMTTPTPASKPILEFLAYKLHIINEAEIREHVHYYSKEDIVNLINELNEFYNLELIKYKKFELGVNSLIVIKKGERI